jgi:hypothetical protein
MHLKTIIALSLPVLGALAAPRPQADCMSHPRFTNASSFVPVLKTTLSLTLTISHTHTYTATATATASASSSTSCTAAITNPTAPYGIIAAHSTSKIHLLPWTASGRLFYLGGETQTYCPESVGACPNGTVSTAFLGTCGMVSQQGSSLQIRL